MGKRGGSVEELLAEDGLWGKVPPPKGVAPSRSTIFHWMAPHSCVYVQCKLSSVGYSFKVKKVLGVNPGGVRRRHGGKYDHYILYACMKFSTN